MRNKIRLAVWVVFISCLMMTWYVSVTWVNDLVLQYPSRPTATIKYVLSMADGKFAVLRIRNDWPDITFDELNNDPRLERFKWNRWRVEDVEDAALIHQRYVFDHATVDTAGFLLATKTWTKDGVPIKFFFAAVPMYLVVIVILLISIALNARKTLVTFKRGERNSLPSAPSQVPYSHRGRTADQLP